MNAAFLLLAAISFAGAALTPPVEEAPKLVEEVRVKPKSKGRQAVRRRGAPVSKPIPRGRQEGASSDTRGQDRAGAVPAAPPPGSGLRPPTDAALAAWGAMLTEGGAGLSVTSALPGSEAEAMGVLPGDILSHLGPKPAGSAAGAALGILTHGPERRMHGVAWRGLSSVPLSGRAPAARPPFERRLGELSAREKSLRDKRLEDAGAVAEAELDNRPPQEIRLAAGQTVWVRFPQGLPADLQPGTVVAGETTTGISTDKDLDFLSLPPKSQVWARVVDAHGPSDTRNLKLFFFKMRPAGGSTYPIAARVSDITGDQRLTRVSPGGTIVMAYPQSIAADAKLKVEFLAPVTLVEPPAFFQAGPGLWIRTSEDGRGFTISHVIDGRAAHFVGLKPGDSLAAIEGRGANDLDFAAALAALYGPGGSDVKVGVIRSEAAQSGGKVKAENLTLRRGVKYAEGEPVTLPTPYAK